MGFQAAGLGAPALGQEWGPLSFLSCGALGDWQGGQTSPIKSGPGNRGSSACGPTHVARLEFPRETVLILRCAGKADISEKVHIQLLGNELQQSALKRQCNKDNLN